MNTEAAQYATVTDYLTADHRRLDAILDDAARLAASPATAARALARYEEFQRGLTRHILVEEEILFPAFERASGMSGGGPTAVMRVEHVAIREILADLHAALSASDPGRFQYGVTDLVGVLSPHNMKEEHMLYPMSDQFAGDDRARAELVRRMIDYAQL